ncbi:hypothetical protein NicSoilB8_16330 [Arthrobacter sp. NicSoilB8]|nr:hypothetical protein NicSoilB8_16330 [Arthrobacter sp. NicSoilB8]
MRAGGGTYTAAAVHHLRVEPAVPDLLNRPACRPAALRITAVGVSPDFGTDNPGVPQGQSGSFEGKFEFSKQFCPCRACAVGVTIRAGAGVSVSEEGQQRTVGCVVRLQVGHDMSGKAGKCIPAPGSGTAFRTGNAAPHFRGVTACTSPASSATALASGAAPAGGAGGGTAKRGEVDTQGGTKPFALHGHGHEAVFRPVAQGVRDEAKDVFGPGDSQMIWSCHKPSFAVTGTLRYAPVALCGQLAAPPETAPPEPLNHRTRAANR